MLHASLQELTVSGSPSTNKPTWNVRGVRLVTTGKRSQLPNAKHTEDLGSTTQRLLATCACLEPRPVHTYNQAYQRSWATVQRVLSTWLCPDVLLRIHDEKEAANIRKLLQVAENLHHNHYHTSAFKNEESSGHGNLSTGICRVRTIPLKPLPARAILPPCSGRPHGSLQRGSVRPQPCLLRC